MAQKDSPSLWTMACRLGRHLTGETRRVQRLLPADARLRIASRVAASEARHTGEIRICVEANLPWSYLWRHFIHRVPIEHIARERALMMFSKLRTWDTEHNNGVLIYLLQAEHHIELVADRGLNQHVAPAEWHAMVQRLVQALQNTTQTRNPTTTPNPSGAMENGLTQALEEVSAVLVQYFPLPAGSLRTNELPNQPVVLL